MAEQPHPWDRLPDESDAAFAAFSAYLKLGAARSIDAVAAQLGGHQKGTKRAPGRLKKWASEHAWVDRAGTYDNHVAAQRQKGVDREAEDLGAEAERIRRVVFGRLTRIGELALAKAEELARFPIKLVRVDEGAKTTNVHPLDPKDLRLAVTIARDAQLMLREAIQDAIGDADDDFDPTEASPEELRAYLEAQVRRRKARA